MEISVYHGGVAWRVYREGVEFDVVDVIIKRGELGRSCKILREEEEEEESRGR